MKTFVTFVLFVLIALSLASITAWILVGVVDVSYERLLTRGLLLYVALGAWPLTRILQIDWSAVGFTEFDPVIAAKAAVLGMTALLPVMLVFVVSGYRVQDTGILENFSDPTLFPLAITGAFAVGLFEETLFRGVFYTRMRAATSIITATFVTSVCYAAVHFLTTDIHVPKVEWYSGFTLLGAGLQNLLDYANHWDSFVSLFLLGILFCVVRQRFSLWACIGLHAGFVFGIRMFKEATDRDISSPYVSLVGSYDNFVGLLVAAWIVFLLVCFTLSDRFKNQSY